MASQPSLRIGDSEREAVAAELREHFAHGRLTMDELSERLDAVFAAKTQADLAPITRDLPHVRTGGAPLPSARSDRRLQATAIPAGAWPGQDQAGWQGGRQHYGHQRHRFGVLATLIAALASFAIVYDVILASIQVSLPGRLALLVAVFAVVRGLLRRILKGARRSRPPRRPRPRW